MPSSISAHAVEFKLIILSFHGRRYEWSEGSEVSPPSGSASALFDLRAFLSNAFHMQILFMRSHSREYYAIHVEIYFFFWFKLILCSNFEVY